MSKLNILSTFSDKIQSRKVALLLSLHLLVCYALYYRPLRGELPKSVKGGVRVFKNQGRGLDMGGVK